MERAQVNINDFLEEASNIVHRTKANELVIIVSKEIFNEKEIIFGEFYVKYDDTDAIIVLNLRNDYTLDHYGLDLNELSKRYKDKFETID